MVDVLKNLMLAASCFHLVAGCCWNDGFNVREDRGVVQQIRLISGLANPLPASTFAETGPQDGAPNPDDKGHICLSGIAAGVVCSVAVASCGVQICNSAAPASCPSSTCAVARTDCDARHVSLAGSCRLHLAKQVMLI
jgi:hypothetical protein